jgi:hypothetical protein
MTSVVKLFDHVTIFVENINVFGNEMPGNAVGSK